MAVLSKAKAIVPSRKSGFLLSTIVMLTLSF